MRDDAGIGRGFGVNPSQPPWGPASPDPRAIRAQPPAGGEPAWDQLFELDDVRRPAPGQSKRAINSRQMLMAAGALVVVLSMAATLWMVFGRNSGEDGMEASPSAPVDPAAQSRLDGMLPPGYPQGSCQPARSRPATSLAAAECGQNGDPGGPLAGSYTLFGSQSDLSPALNEVISSSTTVECPGRIQSPGAWRRNATPQLASGTLFCGIRESRPIVAWTDDARLLLNVVRGESSGPTMEQLYTWWSTHS